MFPYADYNGPADQGLLLCRARVLKNHRWLSNLSVHLKAFHIKFRALSGRSRGAFKHQHEAGPYGVSRSSRASIVTAAAGRVIQGRGLKNNSVLSKEMMRRRLKGSALHTAA